MACVSDGSLCSVVHQCRLYVGLLPATVAGVRKPIYLVVKGHGYEAQKHGRRGFCTLVSAGSF